MRRTIRSERALRRRAGFTLIETMIVMTILGMLAQALVESASGMGRVTTSANVQGVLAEQGERALSGIIDDLRRSAFVDLGGASFPYTFDEGVAAEPFDAHSHAPSVSAAQAGDSDFGANREIVFVLPRDADNDGRPDIDPDTGDVLWSADQVSFTLETLQDGRNALMRRVNGLQARSIAYDIERISFDTPEQLGYQIPLNSVRVQIYLRRIGNNGATYRHMSEVVLRLRNFV